MQIIESIQIECPVTAKQFLHWLKSDYGIKHPNYSSFVVLHNLAAKKRFKELRSCLELLLQVEGIDFSTFILNAVH